MYHQERNGIEMAGGTGDARRMMDELDSMSLNIRSKKFYLDVKQNRSGRFIKVAEINVSGHKNKIIFDMKSSKILLEKLNDFVELYATMGPQGEKRGSGQYQPLKSDSFRRGPFDRVYHLDLGQNEKGKFLKLSCVTTMGGGGRYPGWGRSKQSVVFPAQGIVEFRDALKELVKKYYVEEDEPDLPEPKQFRIANKTVFMDIGYNKTGYNKGHYMKISEVSREWNGMGGRQTITLPLNSWATLRDNLDAFITEVGVEEKQHQGDSGDHAEDSEPKAE